MRVKNTTNKPFNHIFFLPLTMQISVEDHTLSLQKMSFSCHVLKEERIYSSNVVAREKGENIFQLIILIASKSTLFAWNQEFARKSWQQFRKTDLKKEEEVKDIKFVDTKNKTSSYWVAVYWGFHSFFWESTLKSTKVRK